MLSLDFLDAHTLYFFEEYSTAIGQQIRLALLVLRSAVFLKPDVLYAVLDGAAIQPSGHAVVRSILELDLAWQITQCLEFLSERLQFLFDLTTLLFRHLRVYAQSAVHAQADEQHALHTL